MKERLVVSACLLGTNCKYSGGNNCHPAVQALGQRYELVEICPERDGGLPIPRAPAERVGDRVINRDGVDVTEEYLRGARLALAAAKANGCTRAVLKERSPSCGCGLIYDGTFTGSLIPGYGVAAELLKQNGIIVLGESQLDSL